MFILDDGTARYKDATQFMRDYMDSRPIYILSDDGMSLHRASFVVQRFNSAGPPAPETVRQDLEQSRKLSFFRRLVNLLVGG